MHLKDYIETKNITVTKAAREIPCSREWIYKHFSGVPLGYRTALKVKAWSKGKVPLRDSMHLAGK